MLVAWRGVAWRGESLGFGREACRCRRGMDRHISHPWLKCLPRTSLCAVHTLPAAPRPARLEGSASVAIALPDCGMGLGLRTPRPAGCVDAGQSVLLRSSRSRRRWCGRWMAGGVRRVGHGWPTPPLPAMDGWRRGGALPPPAASRGADCPEERHRLRSPSAPAIRATLSERIAASRTGLTALLHRIARIRATCSARVPTKSRRSIPR